MEELTGKLLIADDEVDYCSILSHLMEREGFETRIVHDGASALRSIRTETPDLLLLDIKMPDMDGMEVLKRLKEEHRKLPVVIISAFADISGAVKAVRLGADDYLAKPFDHIELLDIVKRLIRRWRLCRAIDGEVREDQKDHPLRQTMGHSKAVQKLIRNVTLVAPCDFSVLILGETGSGKEVVAQAIHRASSRAGGPFVAVDCGAIPETLLESELFGHERGAFTNAVARKPGKFEQAQGGTIFLDEISNMPIASQSKLLRALQEKTIFRVGGSQPIKIDVRILAATNQNLEAQINSGGFRRDLFFRLNEFTIITPPLRERTEDIPHLAGIFLEKANRELNKQVKGFTDGAINALLSYDWPGNVRQLRSVVRRASLPAEKMISEEHLDIHHIDISERTQVEEKVCTTVEIHRKNMSLKEVVRRSVFDIEKETIKKVLEQTGGNKAKTARILQVDYKTILSKIKKYGIFMHGG